MEQIEELKVELEQAQKELKDLCYKAWKKNRTYYVPEINRLIRKVGKLQIKINQLRQKNWYWK
jgi:hypothetical protein